MNDDDLDQVGPAETRLIAAERRTVRINDMLEDLKREVAALQQGVWDSWADWRARGVVPAPVVAATRNTPFSGSTGGCISFGTTVSITRDSDGTVLWTGTSDSTFGSFSGSVLLATDTPVTVHATSPNSRLADAAVSKTLVAGATSNNLGSILCPPAAGFTPADGYYCGPGCIAPLKSTLTLVDSVNGTFTLTFLTGTTSSNSPWANNWVQGMFGGIPAYAYGLHLNNNNASGFYTANTYDTTPDSQSCPPSPFQAVYHNPNTPTNTYTITEA